MDMKLKTMKVKKKSLRYIDKIDISVDLTNDNSFFEIMKNVREDITNIFESSEEKTISINILPTSVGSWDAMFLAIMVETIVAKNMKNISIRYCGDLVYMI